MENTKRNQTIIVGVIAFTIVAVCIQHGIKMLKNPNPYASLIGTALFALMIAVILFVGWTVMSNNKKKDNIGNSRRRRR